MWYVHAGQESQEYQPEELNKRAVAITQRVKQKLTGKDLMYQMTGSDWEGHSVPTSGAL